VLHSWWRKDKWEEVDAREAAKWFVENGTEPPEGELADAVEDMEQ
jgi:hypothetical protein